ncbi:hypothetical protein LNV08_15260 [Paucibacter sp. TC2R-5]|uniref:hypothetical protein n=1 Tax=Paucibacter sp. TC2R-5 TaxID=2893555 RepID=UPI0021E3F1BB|nr:hypothetical protein [Paucibacter sp. TC2R-5]MCV2360333.1 hypothetical protein [Paucibacter sp. TC2R-5]
MDGDKIRSFPRRVAWLSMQGIEQQVHQQEMKAADEDQEAQASPGNEVAAQAGPKA